MIGYGGVESGTKLDGLGMFTLKGLVAESIGDIVAIQT